MTENGITTDRLVLREVKEEDWRAVHAYASDPEVVRFVDFGPNTEQETRDFIDRAVAAEKCVPRLAHDLVVVQKESGEIIGGCGIHVTKPEQGEAFIGYVLGRRFWGQGYATEVARALLGCGFETLALRRIYAVCDAKNPASARVMEKAGMRREGWLRENALVKGKYRDELMYAILDRDWRERPEGENTTEALIR
jgi:RimJ/RimL family protein N-acetyltransferase